MSAHRRRVLMVVVIVGVTFIRCAAQTKTTLDLSDKVEPTQQTQQQVTAGKDVKLKNTQDVNTKTGWSGVEVLLVVGSLVLLMMLWDIARDYGPSIFKRLLGKSP